MPMSRRLRTWSAILLLIALGAVACGGDGEEASDTSGINDAAGINGATAPSGSPGGGEWPHCVEYQRLLEAIARLDSADSADTREGSEGAELIADLELENATARYEAASSAAVAAAEELAADETAEPDARRAAEVALEAFAAAADASRLVVFGDSVEPLGTPSYVEAFDLALEAVQGGSGEGLDIETRLATLEAETARLEAEISAEILEASEEPLSERREAALAEKQATLAQWLEEEWELRVIQEEQAAARAELEAVEADLAWAQLDLDSTRESLASAVAEFEAASARLSDLDVVVVSLRRFQDDAYSVAAVAEDQLEQVLETARNDAEVAAEVARADAELRARALETVAAIARSFGASNSVRHDAAYQAVYDRAVADAEIYGLSNSYSIIFGWSPASLTADDVARDAAFAAQAGMARRLDDLARQAGIDENIDSAFESALSAWVAAWPLAEDRGSVSARATVMDRQPLYDDLAYRAAARVVRVAVAEAVPPAQSVAAAEAEDVYWAEGGAAFEAFAAARDRINAARVDHRGLVHPGTDDIAWNAFHVALEILENRAVAEAADVRDRASQDEADPDPEADRRVVNARARVERTAAAAAEAESNLSSAETAYSEAASVVARRESEVSEWQVYTDSAESWWNSAFDSVNRHKAELAALRVPTTGADTTTSLERAQRTAWVAVAGVTGCV